jgi:hypothetical protein
VIAQLLAMLRGGCHQQAARAAANQPRPARPPPPEPLALARSPLSSSSGSSLQQWGLQQDEPAGSTSAGSGSSSSRPISLLQQPFLDYQALISSSGPNPNAAAGQGAAQLAAAASWWSSTPGAAAAEGASSASISPGSSPAATRSPSLEPVYESADEGSLHSVGLSSVGGSPAQPRLPGQAQAPQQAPQLGRAGRSRLAAGGSGRGLLGGDAASAAELETAALGWGAAAAGSSGNITSAAAPPLPPLAGPISSVSGLGAPHSQQQRQDQAGSQQQRQGQQGRGQEQAQRNSVLLTKQVSASRRLQVLVGGMRSPATGSAASSSRRSSNEGLGCLPAAH